MVGDDELPRQQQQRRRALRRVTGIVFLDIFALALLAPAFALFVTDGLFDGDSGGAALFTGAVTAVASVVEFASQPVLGAAADARGRRPVLQLCLAVQSVCFLAMAALPHKGVLALCMVLRAAFASTYTLAVTMVADLHRGGGGVTEALGKVAAVAGVAGILGVGAGTGLSSRSLSLPFFAGGVVHLLNAAFVKLAVPETLENPTAPTQPWRLQNPLPSLKVLCGTRELSLLALIFFVSSLASKGVGHTFLYWTQYRFDWDTKAVAIFLGYFGVLVAVSMSCVRFALRQGERRVLTLGYSVLALCFALIGAVRQPLQLYVVLFFGALGFVTAPALHGLLTKSFPADAQGASQGALSAVAVCASGLGPLLFTGVYDAAKGDYEDGSDSARADAGAGAPFFLGAACFALCVLVARSLGPSSSGASGASDGSDGSDPEGEKRALSAHDSVALSMSTEPIQGLGEGGDDEL